MRSYAVVHKPCAWSNPVPHYYDSPTYNSRRPLICRENKNLDRALGVWVSGPHPHALEPGVPYVDLEYERLSINTSTFINSYPQSAVQPQIIDCTIRVINNLNIVISELIGHRDRLVDELERLQRG